MTDTADSRWPPLPYDGWADTYATLHMWTQVVGKIAVALAPPLNHSWGVTFTLTPRGVTTRRLQHGGRAFTIEFDFTGHRLLVCPVDDVEQTLALEPMTVADFYRQTMAMMRKIGSDVRIWPMPVEIPSPIRFDQDTVHRSYDPVFVNRWWRILSQVDDVLTRSRCNFVGKCSPSHFFWGAFDLAVTRFSGRAAPPRDGPAFMREAYSHEVISHGFWPGSVPVLEPAFYAYAVPEPAGFKEITARPAGAYYHRELGEFILPYEVVRGAASPEAAIAAFVTSTYEQGADLAKWDRDLLERRGARAGA